MVYTGIGIQAQVKQIKDNTKSDELINGKDLLLINRCRNFQIGDAGGDFNPTNLPIMSDTKQSFH